MPSNEFYADAELHDHIEEEVHAGNKGGPAGKWSAKKEEIVEEEYKKQGGEYKDESEVDKGDDGDDSRDQDEDDNSQPQDSKWACMEDGDDEEETKHTAVTNGKGKGRGKNKQDEKDKDMKDAKEEESQSDDEDDIDEADKDTTSGNKRKKSKQNQASAKKQKANSGEPAEDKNDNTESQSNGTKTTTHGSKHDPTDEPAPRGSNTRLPKKGQKVSWKAMPGWVHGKVLEVVISNKTMHGKSIKASKEDARLALEAESGKFCVHRPDNCYFEDA